MASDPDAPIAYSLTDAARQAIAAHRAEVADRYLITSADGWTELWCRLCTSSGNSYVAEWRGSPDENSAAILAARVQHEKEQH